jgi:UDP-3-O-[3-hydroxymyristoyl] N-acetylglucosamine deacetylase
LQKTLKSDVMLKGVGLHCGRDVSLRVRPAAAQTGIWFRRTDTSDADPFISANWQFAVHTELCTRLVNADGLGVSTVEHVMAAIAGCGINNAVVEVDGPEVPIMDGSALEFVRGFLKAGLIEQAAPVKVLEILQTVEVEENGAYAALVPFSGIEMDFSIDFPDEAIGQQSKTLNLANGSFVHELCDSRTFCRNSDVQVMRSKGLALGGTLMNAVVIEGADVLSPGGMRHADEPVRHKMLDAMGDLALAGGPIIGRYVGRRAGHTLTNKLLRKLFSQPGAFRRVACDAQTSGRLPGAGLVQEDVHIYA